jgi:DedD protein
MRQTSQAASEQQGLRDVERWKEKIEIRLDNRQVAFLFFGSALIACLLFILGVIVGKRLESRGHALAPEIEDPLALLDRVASALPTTAVAVAPAPHPADVAVSRAEPAAAAAAARRIVAAEAAASSPPTRTAPKADDPVATVSAGLTATMAKLAPKKLADKPADKPEPVAKADKPAVAAMTLAMATPPATKPAEPTRPSNPEIMPPSSLGPAPTAAVASKATLPPPAAAAPGKGRFMLQVGSFLERAEAEAFASSFASEHPVVITSELPGKGTWYRVRVGSYQAFKEAVEAKLEFEKRFSKIALVVGPM